MAEEIITKTFEFKLRKNRTFEAACLKALDNARFVYNCALEQRIIRHKQGKPVRYYEQSRELTEARKAIPELKSCLRKIQEDALERLDEAFQSFFRRLKTGGRPGFPRFKGRDHYHTFSQRFEKVRACPLKGDRLTVPGVGSARVRLSRPIEGMVKQLRITRRVDGWHALITCDIKKPEPLPITGLSVGVDVGLTSFATLSNGETIQNPQCFKRAEEKLAKTQRYLARKKRGSQNRKKARKITAHVHLKISRCRRDFHHKEAKKLVDRFDRIAVESLNIRGMVRNRHLAKSISDVGWSQWFGILKSKAENAGREFTKIPAAFTSQTCSACGHRQKMPLKIRIFVCENCEHILDRDHNAAINIGSGRPESTPVESHERR